MHLWISQCTTPQKRTSKSNACTKLLHTEPKLQTSSKHAHFMIASDRSSQILERKTTPRKKEQYSDSLGPE
jgi:hypothetical protein